MADDSRWTPWFKVFEAYVPLTADMADRLGEDGDNGTDYNNEWDQHSPGAIWATLVIHVGLEEEGPAGLVMADFWRPFLALVELTAAAAEILEAEIARAHGDPHEDDDLVELWAFVGAGVTCDVTQRRDDVNSLLPWCGPLTTAYLRDEVASHDRVPDLWRGDDADWATAGRLYKPLPAIDAADLLPRDRRPTY